MAKVTSKLQVTIPKRLAQDYEIAPGDDIEWLAAGDSIRVLPAHRRERRLELQERLELFDAATDRARRRHEETATAPAEDAADRGWTRAQLYERNAAR